ncbi:MAG: hypothetical protein J2P52_07845 [Blastocatellia bacterium]|nr:hypothetical protein [Blastocatellia bacterium]
MFLDCQGTSAQTRHSTAPRDRLKRFAAEVATVLVQTEPLLRMIVCDADVHQVQDFSCREGAKLLRGFEFNVTEGPTSGRSSQKRRSGSRIC